MRENCINTSNKKQKMSELKISRKRKASEPSQQTVFKRQKVEMVVYLKNKRLERSTNPQLAFSNWKNEMLNTLHLVGNQEKLWAQIDGKNKTETAIQQIGEGELLKEQVIAKLVRGDLFDFTYLQTSTKGLVKIVSDFQFSIDPVDVITQEGTLELIKRVSYIYEDAIYSILPIPPLEQSPS